MSSNDPNTELRAQAVVDPQTGITVTTTGVTLYPGKLDLRIPQGRSWSTYVTWHHKGQIANLTGGTAAFTAAASYGGSALISLTQAAGITLGTAYATIALSAAQTAALDFVRGAYNFDLTVGGTVFPLLEGFIDLERSAT